MALGFLSGFTISLYKKWWAVDSYGSSIVFVIHSVDHSLSIRLIPPYKSTIAPLIQSLDGSYRGW